MMNTTAVYTTYNATDLEANRSNPNLPNFGRNYTEEAIISSTNMTTFGMNYTLNATSMGAEWEPPTWFTYVMTIVNLLLFAFGMIGNSSILSAVLRSVNRTHPYNVLIIALAISDKLALATNTVNLLDLLEIFPVDVTALSNIGCAIDLSVRTFGSFASVSITTLICLERFVAIVYPLKFRLVWAKKFTFVSLSVCVGFDLVAGSLLSGLYSEVHDGQCHINGNSDQIIPYTPLRVVLYSVAVAIPVLIVASLTPIIIYKLYKQHAGRSELSNQAPSGGLFQRNLMLTSVVIAFIILYVIPSTVYLLLGMDAHSDTETTPYPVAKICILTCLQVNHSINFLFYGISNDKFRKQLVDQFGCLCQFECSCRQEQSAEEENGEYLPVGSGDICIEMQDMHPGPSS